LTTINVLIMFEIQVMKIVKSNIVSVKSYLNPCMCMDCIYWRDL